MNIKTLPRIISGGMGVDVSSRKLARKVSMHGSNACMGNVSGTAIETMMARELQLGDSGGLWKLQFKALAPLLTTPMRKLLWQLYARYYISGGKAADAPFKRVPPPRLDSGLDRYLLTIVANFGNVRMAKEGHDRPVGINFLRKIESQLLPALLGAMLAGVDVVSIGAGDPSAMPEILDRLAQGLPVSIPVKVPRAEAGQEFQLDLDPREFILPGVVIPRPWFLAIISSHEQAVGLYGNPAMRPNGFVVEHNSAGGHNAPPAGAKTFGGGPIEYSERDEPDISVIAGLGLPFWLAGSYGDSDGLARALKLGATGIQVGTPFAVCDESGMDEKWKLLILDQIWLGVLVVETTRVSPTGFPFKAVTSIPGTIVDDDVSEDRTVVCDAGYLATPTWIAGKNGKPGRLDYICPAEPPKTYKRKGGSPYRAPGAKCVCNALLATARCPQMRPDGSEEPPLLTLGDHWQAVREIQRRVRSKIICVDDIIDYLLNGRIVPISS